MNGKEFFEKMEAAFPGFLKAAYGGLVFSKEADERASYHLEPFARHCGCERLTGPMVGHARQEQGLVHRRPRAQEQRPVPRAESVVEAPVLPLEAQEPPDLIGLLVGLDSKLTALYGEVGMLARRVRELEDPPIGIPATSWRTPFQPGMTTGSPLPDQPITTSTSGKEGVNAS